VLLVATGVLWEWNKLSRRIAASWWARALWLVAGVVYVGVDAEVLNVLNGWAPGPRDPVPTGFIVLLAILLMVIATDIGAYFAGRTFGGPKIAPKISPSKTWSGLFGGALGAGLVLVVAASSTCHEPPSTIAPWGYCVLHHWSDFGNLPLLLIGALIAIVAQTGDFFESWMKRRAGVKDSGHLIPGHGGLFDRVDGLLAVLFVAGLVVGLGRVF
jgi:phosphatidate cytidylyltransferase